jgi:hypothetical protein
MYYIIIILLFYSTTVLEIFKYDIKYAKTLHRLNNILRGFTILYKLLKRLNRFFNRQLRPDQTIKTDTIGDVPGNFDNKLVDSQLKMAEISTDIKSLTINIDRSSFTEERT